MCASHHRAHDLLPVDGAQGSEGEAMRCQRLTQLVYRHASLKTGHLPLGVDLQDLVQALQRKDDAFGGDERRARVHSPGTSNLVGFAHLRHHGLDRGGPPELARIHVGGLCPIRHRPAVEKKRECDAGPEEHANWNEGEGEAPTQKRHSKELKRIAKQSDGRRQEGCKAIQNPEIFDAKLVEKICMVEAEEHQPRNRLQQHAENLHLEHRHQDHQEKDSV
mmetsp:Transcript_121913/g.339910  ORF Transcript_121913/g.339910 Transcript_121913/m.339910 type:complete len:220 (+) Transcript_121913:1131-1790(+)